MKKAILLGWFFLTFWDGRISRFDFATEAICNEARSAVVTTLGGDQRRATKCIGDSR